jgi:citrate lyase subunit beta/citryl-CoA lyase
MLHDARQAQPQLQALRFGGADLARAQRIVQACAGEAGAQRVDGRLVDRPVLLAAQRQLRRAA